MLQQGDGRDEGGGRGPHPREPGDDQGFTQTGEAGRNRGKRHLRRATRLVLLTGMCRYKGRYYQNAQVAQLATAEVIVQCHAALGTASLGHTFLPYLPTPPPKKHIDYKSRSKPTHVRIFSYNAESCCSTGRLDELLSIAEENGCAVVALQGTQLEVDTEWQSGPWKCVCRQLALERIRQMGASRRCARTCWAT